MMYMSEVRSLFLLQDLKMIKFDAWLRYGIKPLLFVVCLLPLGWIVFAGMTSQLGSNPIEKVMRFTGDWTLRLLLVTLTVTPLRRLTGWAWLIRLRRMLGLFAFFYAVLHLLTYLVLDQFFAWDEIAKDILKRPYITVGFATFLLLIPLAVTSTNNMVKRLGGKRWLQLHKLVYVCGTGGVLHYLWLVKADYRKAIIHASILLVLLGYRAWYARRERVSPALNRPATAK